VLFIPTNSGHTGLTSVSHWSDQCRPLLGFARVNVWVSSLLSLVTAVSSLGLFGARYACLVFLGFLAWIGLTDVFHRPDRCLQVSSAGAVCTVVLTGLTGVGQ
jgi:hypothetical protein